MPEESTAPRKPRDQALDIVSGVLILWMLFYHLMQWAGLTENVVYREGLRWLFFFMPWFYFKSGMLFKPQAAVPFAAYAGKCATRLLGPLVLWFAIGYVVRVPVMLESTGWPVWRALVDPLVEFVREGSTVGNDPLWFLLSLFFVQLAAPWVLKAGWAWLALLPSAGWLLASNSEPLPLGIATLPLGLFFFAAGMVHSKSGSNHRFGWIPYVVVPIFVVVNLLVPSYVDFRLNRTVHGHYMVYVLMSLVALPVVLRLARMVRSEPLAWVGRHSMHLFVMHWPLFALVAWSAKACGLWTPGWTGAFFMGGVASAVCLVVTKCFGRNPVLFGR